MHLTVEKVTVANVYSFIEISGCFGIYDSKNKLELNPPNGNRSNMPIKNPGLNLFIKTWPKNKNSDSEENKRPLTATLEKPTILDIRLMGKIDMSKIRKEFLNISNLCRVPILLKKSSTNKGSKLSRPLSLPPARKKTNRHKTRDPDDSWEDEESLSSAKLSTKQAAKSKTIEVKKKSKCCDNNNNKNSKLPRKNTAVVKVLGLDIKASIKLPEPCKSCGRSDQPERFHSHPLTPLKPPKSMEEAPKVTVKSSVQKPVAIKYKSRIKNEKKPSPLVKRSIQAQKLVLSTPTSGYSKPSESTVSEPKCPVAGPRSQLNPKATDCRVPKLEDPLARAASAKRTLTCYLCGREFGSASLPLHEPKCLQKWERENASLPSHLQRRPPPRPDSSVNRDEWNKSACEASQLNLVPCSKCRRTFYPDRLIVHQRSCQSTQFNKKVSSTELQLPDSLVAMSRSTPSTPSSARPPPTFECYICGKKFGVNSIKIHEKQCLKKWNIENDSLPSDMRSPPPIRKEKTLEPSRISRRNSDSDKEQETRPSSSRKPPLFPCYICGKLFTVNSIYIHEPQCLKMWKNENDKLPPNKRRPQPLKPDIKFTRDGKIDYQATTEAHWQVHLSQLVPCKNCSRTFNPDRVEIHERSCKGC